MHSNMISSRSVLMGQIYKQINTPQAGELFFFKFSAFYHKPEQKQRTFNGKNKLKYPFNL